jgi:hypothetical protein
LAKATGKEGLWKGNATEGREQRKSAWMLSTEWSLSLGFGKMFKDL